MANADDRESRPLRPELQTVTSSSLLEGLMGAANGTRWQEYVDRYRPLIVAFARARGLGGDEAEDLAQTVLLEFSRAYRAGRYDARKGRLRSWLFGIVFVQLKQHWRATERRAPAGARLETQVEDGLASEDELESRWDEQWRRTVLAQALLEVRVLVQPATFAAFERFALQERSASEVAAELGMTENAVFGAKRRVLERLREVLPLMEDSW